jgi:hypothetical protein
MISGAAERAERRDQHDQPEHAGDAIDQVWVSSSPRRFLYSAEDGHEGLRERALGKHAAQQVGQAEGDEEGVGRHAGAEGARDDEVAHEAEDAGQQGHAADGGEWRRRRRGAEADPLRGQQVAQLRVTVPGCQIGERLDQRLVERLELQALLDVLSTGAQFVLCFPVAAEHQRVEHGQNQGQHAEQHQDPIL